MAVRRLLLCKLVPERYNHSRFEWGQRTSWTSWNNGRRESSCVCVCVYVTVAGSPKVLVVRVVVLSVHRRKSVGAARAGVQPSRAAAARPVWWIAGRPAVHRAAHCRTARCTGDWVGSVVQPAGVSPHVSRHPAGWCRRRRRLCPGAGPVAARQQTGSDRLPVWLHSFPREYSSHTDVFLQHCLLLLLPLILLFLAVIQYSLH